MKATCGFLPPQALRNTIHPRQTTTREESSSQELHGSAVPRNAGPGARRPDAEHQHPSELSPSGGITWG